MALHINFRYKNLSYDNIKKNTVFMSVLFSTKRSLAGTLRRFANEVPFGREVLFRNDMERFASFCSQSEQYFIAAESRCFIRAYARA